MRRRKKHIQGDVTGEFEDALREQNESSEKYVLRLYVSGMTIKSLNAVENVKRLCEKYMLGHYELEVIDIRAHPELAGEAEVIALPTLIKELPLPLRKFIGDMSEKEKLLVGLNVVSKKTQSKQNFRGSQFAKPFWET